MLNTFPKGIHTADCKQLSCDKEIEVMQAPKLVSIPICQSIGALPEISVKEGEHVKRGQLIAKESQYVSANVFSSVSGTVKGFEVKRLASGLSGKHILIENDFQNETELLEKLENPTSEQIVARADEAGIVGMGGAAFPTKIKLKIPSEKKCDVLIINGAECEPYITCDYRICLELADELFQGIELLKVATNAEKVVFGIESNKLMAIENLTQKAPSWVEIMPLKTKYPQGAEKQLIYAVTKRKVPIQKLPIDVGVIVQNVHTALSLKRACIDGLPCFERIVTVSGGAIAAPKNLWVPTGTSFQDVANFCGGVKEDVKKVLNGGPMMGFAQFDLGSSTTKTTGAILFLTKEEVNLDMPHPCINCARCSKVCPMYLMPMYIDNYGLVGEYSLAKKYGATSCIECGCCTYVCPSKRPLVQSIRLSKKIIKDKKI